MGEVYRAEDLKLKRIVALKRISPRYRDDPEYRKRFLREAEKVSSLSDPRITSIHDVIEHEGELLLVMEYIDGSSLRSRLGSPLSLKDFLKLGIQCVEALKAAH